MKPDRFGNEKIDSLLIVSRLVCDGLNPVSPGLFEVGAAWGEGGGCPRPITLKLLMIMK